MSATFPLYICINITFFVDTYIEHMYSVSKCDLTNETVKFISYFYNIDGYLLLLRCGVYISIYPHPFKAIEPRITFWSNLLLFCLV